MHYFYSGFNARLAMGSKDHEPCESNQYHLNQQHHIKIIGKGLLEAHGFGSVVLHFSVLLYQLVVVVPNNILHRLSNRSCYRMHA